MLAHPPPIVEQAPEAVLECPPLIVDRTPEDKFDEPAPIFE